MFSKSVDCHTDRLPGRPSLLLPFPGAAHDPPLFICRRSFVFNPLVRRSPEKTGHVTLQEDSDKDTLYDEKTITRAYAHPCNCHQHSSRFLELVHCSCPPYDPRKPDLVRTGHNLGAGYMAFLDQHQTKKMIVFLGARKRSPSCKNTSSSAWFS